MHFISLVKDQRLDCSKLALTNERDHVIGTDIESIFLTGVDEDNDVIEFSLTMCSNPFADFSNTIAGVYSSPEDDFTVKMFYDGKEIVSGKINPVRPHAFIGRLSAFVDINIELPLGRFEQIGRML